MPLLKMLEYSSIQLDEKCTELKYKQLYNCDLFLICDYLMLISSHFCSLLLVLKKSIH